MNGDPSGARRSAMMPGDRLDAVLPKFEKMPPMASWARGTLSKTTSVGRAHESGGAVVIAGVKCAAIHRACSTHPQRLNGSAMAAHVGATARSDDHDMRSLVAALDLTRWIG